MKCELGVILGVVALLARFGGQLAGLLVPFLIGTLALPVLFFWAVICLWKNRKQEGSIGRKNRICCLVTICLVLIPLMISEYTLRNRIWYFFSKDYIDYRTAQQVDVGPSGEQAQYLRGEWPVKSVLMWKYNDDQIVMEFWLPLRTRGGYFGFVTLPDAIERGEILQYYSFLEPMDDEVYFFMKTNSHMHALGRE